MTRLKRGFSAPRSRRGQRTYKGDISRVVGNIGGGDNSKPIDLTGVETYANAMDLIAYADVDIIDICVPTDLHMRYALTALKFGRNVFCEKPLCRTAAEARALVAAAKTARGFFNVGLCVRAWPEYRAAYAEGGWEQAKGATFEMSFTIVCEKATLKLDATGLNIFLKDGKKVTPKLDVKAGPTGWHQELAYFVDCVRKGIKPEKYQTIDSIADTMAIVFAEERSVAISRAVRV